MAKSIGSFLGVPICRFFPEPDVDKTLGPDDAAKILEEVLEAQDQSVFFGIRLGLPLHVVEAIHSRYQKQKDRLLHVIIEFLRQVVRPTWRVIIDTLRSPAVNLPRLADRVEAAHFPDPTPTRDDTVPLCEKLISSVTAQKPQIMPDTGKETAFCIVSE